MLFFIVVPPTAGNSGRQKDRRRVMSQNFKQCPNGHYYQGDHCPYCKSTSGGAAAGSMKTEVFGNQETESIRPTETVPGMGSGMGGSKTIVVDGGSPMTPPPVRPTVDSSTSPMSGRTMFGDMDEMAPSASGGMQRVYRETRKLVGWLVSYTLDPLGVDFKIYEGRNIIGRDMDCNITVNDNMVSSKHAVLLFRAGKYSITDSQSSHGTFVNDQDIELEPLYLQDGDIIKVGQTVFKFRTSF